MKQRQHVQILLIQVQKELKTLNLWQSSAPAEEALQSTEPFAMDTLDFHQWLQFIMIPRIQSLLTNRLPLPDKMAISPMAIEVYRGQLRPFRELILSLRTLDQVISGEDLPADTWDE